jgi:hypothetical protein
MPIEHSILMGLGSDTILKPLSLVVFIHLYILVDVLPKRTSSIVSVDARLPHGSVGAVGYLVFDPSVSPRCCGRSPSHIYSPKYIIYKTDKKLAGQTTASSEVEEEEECNLWRRGCSRPGRRGGGHARWLAAAKKKKLALLFPPDVHCRGEYVSRQFFFLLPRTQIHMVK